ncbi:MAG: hypothetical protein VX519_06530, partial [Myxococcota bacterium]|nr:hypothetical protein [Myxococcota bacterium]
GGIVEDVPVSSSGMGGLADYELAAGTGMGGMGTHHLIWLFMAGLLGGGVTFLLGGIRSGMGETDHGLLGPPMAEGGVFPRLERGAQVWSVGDSGARRQVLTELVRREARFRPVLVVPQSSSRAELGEALKNCPGVAWPRRDRPRVVELLRWGKGLLQPTHGLVILEGSAALESPAPGEEIDEVLVEFLEKNRSDSLVLICDGEVLEFSNVQRVRAQPEPVSYEDA